MILEVRQWRGTALANGNWHFHICARDNAGNWGSVSNIGPFVIDAVLLFSDGFEGPG